ncbi:MAG: hypothetical protein ACE5LU_13060 [Anaerolineae bacterium]
MSGTQDPKVAFEIAEAMVEEFEDYLLGNSLYRQLMVKTSAGHRMPKMSAGSLLERLHDLTHAEETGQLTLEQAHQLADLTDAVDQLADRYAPAYRQKLVRELKSQIDSWRWFMQDCLDDRLRCQDEYPFEVWIRNRIELLMDTLNDRAPADLRSRLRKLDHDLRRVFAPGEFIFDRRLQDRHPRDRYWWLYGRPEGAG